MNCPERAEQVWGEERKEERVEGWKEERKKRPFEGLKERKEVPFDGWMKGRIGEK